MKPGIRKYMGASLKIGVAKSLPVAMRRDVLELSSLYTKPQFRRQGYAGVLLCKVTAEADVARKMLMLRVEPSEGMSHSDLAKFYAMYGFGIIQDAPLLMVRPHAIMALAMRTAVDRKQLNG